jgi:predicted nucleic acid-binding protein
VDGFEQYQLPTDHERRAAITSGLIVLDSNVLLDAYRFAPRARTDLLGALERLGSRLWIPNQVALEFYRNRIRVIGDQEKAYKDALSLVDKFEADAEVELKQKIKQLANRVALADKERDSILRHLDLETVT